MILNKRHHMFIASHGISYPQISFCSLFSVSFNSECSTFDAQAFNDAIYHARTFLGLEKGLHHKPSQQ